MEKFFRNLKIIFVLVLVALATVVWYAVFYWEERQNLLITFFDVGQGDAVFIEVPNGNQILVDGGPNDAVLAKLGRALPFWDKTIDLLILTHPHTDHLNGLLGVLRRYKVGMVLETGVLYATPQVKEWNTLLKERGVRRIIAERGQKIDLGDGAAIYLLAPFEKFLGKRVSKINNASLVGRLVYGKNSVLLAADIEKDIERRLLYSSPQLLDSDILKVPHHGSRTSSLEEFLSAVSPQIAVIQVGRNRYGHPSAEVLERLQEAGVEILRNDQEGDIKFASDGLRIWGR